MLKRIYVIPKYVRVTLSRERLRPSKHEQGAVGVMLAFSPKSRPWSPDNFQWLVKPDFESSKKYLVGLLLYVLYRDAAFITKYICSASKYCTSIYTFIAMCSMTETSTTWRGLTGGGSFRKLYSVWAMVVVYPPVNTHPLIQCFEVLYSQWISTMWSMTRASTIWRGLTGGGTCVDGRWEFLTYLLGNLFCMGYDGCIPANEHSFFQLKVYTRVYMRL